MSIGGIIALGKDDAVESLSRALAAAGSPCDDLFQTQSIEGNIALGVRGRSASPSPRLCEPVGGVFLAGTPPPTQESFGRLSACKNAAAGRSALNILREAFGSLETGYAAISAINRSLVGVRDPVGQRPLFFAATESHIALSSSKKLFWALGDEPQVHSAGVLAQFSSRGARRCKARALNPPPKPSSVSSEEASQVLSKLLHGSVKACVGTTGRVGVLFSGGLDSSVIACVARSLGFDTHLYSSAFIDDRRLSHVEEVAEKLDLDLHVRLVREEETVQALRHAVWAAESADVLQVSVALPLDAAIGVAAEEGETVLLSGSGADELFGGYSRYPKILGRLGEEALSEAMFRDVLRLSEADTLRDGALGESNRVQLNAPFLNLRLVEYALSLPVGFKVRNPFDTLRKHILRDTADGLDVPIEAVHSPKKAAQFSSGAYGAVQKLAQRRGFSAEEYLSRILLDVRKQLVEETRQTSL